MTTLKKSVVIAILIAAIGVGLYKAHQGSQLQEQVESLQQEQATLASQIQQLQQERDDARRQITSLSDEFVNLKADSEELRKLRSQTAELKSTDTPGNQTELAAKSWADRVGQLKQRLEQTPTARIPELQFVTEQDWLNAARGELKTEADYRRALSAIRSAGEGKVASMLQKALGLYVKDNNGQFPVELAQLQRYFDTSLDDAVLQRWEIASAKTVQNLMMGGDMIITQKAPVDDVFDSRFGVGPHGWGSTDFLSSMTETMAPVYEAYRKAHNGEFANHIPELEPYVTTPDQRAAFEKLMLRDSVSK